MNYGAIKKCDIANGVGVRTVLFVSGCTHHCKGCFQPETWNFDYGEKYTKETEDEIIESLRPDYVDGITLLGGEPFEPENQRELVKLLRRIKKELPQKTVWSFSGYTYEELTGDSRAVCEVTNEMLSMLDVLVDGEFVEAKRNISLRFRGSENQRLIDMNKTRKEGKIVLWDK
ncbi:MAG: anaerobic ribonucleoside-triphosphate reductase activating protein [Acutalibacteraceae bacterium]|jgi:anaerobic ribonucleoside-triphosphate reductase activating protein